MNPAQARELITDLEAMIGYRFDDVPVADRDQALASLRDDLRSFEVDTTDPAAMMHVLAGAMCGAGTVLTEGAMCNRTVLFRMTMLLRALADWPTSDGAVLPTLHTHWWQRLSWWRRHWQPLMLTMLTVCWYAGWGWALWGMPSTWPWSLTEVGVGIAGWLLIDRSRRWWRR